MLLNKIMAARIAAGAPPSGATVTYTAFAQTIADTTSYTFNNLAIGQPGLLAIVVHAGSNVTAGITLSSLTVNGVAATRISNIQGRDCAWLAYIRVASGTTVNVVASFSGTAVRGAVAVFRIDGNSSDTPVEVKDTYSSLSTTSRSITFTAAGSGVGVFGASGGAGGSTFTWTNATEQYEAVIESGSDVSGALKNYSTIAGTVSVTQSSSDRMYLSGAFWN